MTFTSATFSFIMTEINMLKHLKKILSGATATSADIAAKLAEYNIPELESQLATAQQRRTDLLLTGTDDEILAAESEATKARLALDRGNAAIVELNRRLEEARVAEAEAAAREQYEDAKAKVDAAVARIEEEYPGLARRLVEIAEVAREADDACKAWSNVYFYGDPRGLPLIDSIVERLGWWKKFADATPFHAATRLPPVGDFEGHAVDWEGAETRFAIHGLPVPQAAQHQYV